MDIQIMKANPSDAEELLEYLKVIGSESNNLTFGPDGILMTLEEEQDQFEIEVKGNEFIVTGPAVERLMGRVNIGDNESYHYMEKMLKKLGIEQALKDKGVKEGDTVKILEWEFEWYE